MVLLRSPQEVSWEGVIFNESLGKLIEYVNTIQTEQRGLPMDENKAAT